MDDSSSGRASLDSASITATSLRSGSSSQNIANDGQIHVYNYKRSDFDKFPPALLCEEICNAICRDLNILPTLQLLYGIRRHPSDRNHTLEAVQHHWVMPGEQLCPSVSYCFRMRFKVPDLAEQLGLIDPNSHIYLYYQMRYDMRHEHIAEIRYPNHKNEVMGLAVIDMVIDCRETSRTAQSIEDDWKKYVPRPVRRVHGFFCNKRISTQFDQLLDKVPKADTLRTLPALRTLQWHYIQQVYNLAPSYMTEQFKASVEHLPNGETTAASSLSLSSLASGSMSSSSSTLVTASNTTLSTTATANGHVNHLNHRQRNDSGSSDSQSLRSRLRMHQQRLQPAQDNSIPVYVKLSFHDSPQPGLKVARITSEATLKWSLVADTEDIFMLYKESDKVVRLEIVGFPKGYRMRFDSEHEIKSFISYLGAYYRLTVKWIQDLCDSYITPSLEELERLHCHGPIGGNFSFTKLHENGDKCGSYIVRQCDEKYNTYYIDINTRVVARINAHMRCQTETFRITRVDKQWKLFYNNEEHIFDDLADLANFIPVDCKTRTRIQASKYDKPPLLLVLLPKNLKTKKTDTKLSEGELQRRNAQIFNPKTDLQWYQEKINSTDDEKVFTMRGDWIQQGSFKDVPVTLKMLSSDANFQEFIDMANAWNEIQSPQFIKLYGLTLSVPYTMVMEWPSHGPLNKFLLQHKDLSMYCLLDMMHGLVRGMHYLIDNKIMHNYIRCSNLLVTRYDPVTKELDAKFSDPGYPRPYRLSDSPWIPTTYYKRLDEAKKDVSTQLWAFATTTWEIFSRGKVALETLQQSDLIRNRAQHGGVLWQLDQRLCPEEIYNTIMDGWSDDPEKRFNHHTIFQRLNKIQMNLQPNYAELVSEETDSDMDHLLTDGDDSSITNGQGTSSNMGFPFALQLNNSQQVIELPDCKVIYRDCNEVGKGHYGTVFEGVLEFNDRNRPNERVAIKKVNTVVKMLPKDFMREIKIMRDLDHPNVVKFKYCTQNPFSIIMELFPLGSFIVYLQSKKDDLTDHRLLTYALDIANGMNYLSGKGLIHRDLAARNILVDRACVKISDFGLAQFANDDGYYYAISQREIPIKWYSLEAIETSKFSSYSDVWSYGVTLFEMFSRGDIPNLVPGVEMTQYEFLDRLHKGERLPQPHLCPAFVYNELMRPCWNEMPKSRPTFSRLVQIIQSELGVNVAAGSQQQQQQHRAPVCDNE